MERLALLGVLLGNVGTVGAGWLLSVAPVPSATVAATLLSVALGIRGCLTVRFLLRD